MSIYAATVPGTTGKQASGVDSLNACSRTAPLSPYRPSSQREGSWLIQGDLNDIKHLTKAFGTYGIYEINDKLVACKRNVNGEWGTDAQEFGFRSSSRTFSQTIKSGPERVLDTSSLSNINRILSVFHFIIDGGPFLAGAPTEKIWIGVISRW